MELPGGELKTTYENHNFEIKVDGFQRFVEIFFNDLKLRILCYL